MFSWVATLVFLVVAGFWSLSYILNTFQSKNPSPPGPPGLPIIGHLHMLGKLPHLALCKLSKKYGPIMKLKLGNVTMIVVSSPEAAELFLKTHDLNFASRPKTQASDYTSYGSKGMAFSEYGPYWRNLRKLCTIHLLTISKVESFMSLRREAVGFLVEHLERAAQGREVVDISTHVGSVIERITYDMILGRGYAQKLNFKPCLQEGMELSGAFNIADYVPFLKAFDLQGLTRRLKNVRTAIDDFFEQIIREHEEKGTGKQEDHRDFIDVMLSLMKTSDPHEEKLDRVTIKAVTVDMLGAAMDTSATAIEWALTELVKHPKVMKTVQEELLNVVGLHRMVEESDLPKLSYLSMVVKETLRLHPVIPLLLPREAIEDIFVGGYYIPKKSRIVINAWAIGRDRNAWSDNVEQFYPERFSDNNIDIGGQDFQIIPFGSGRRKCPGIELGIRAVYFVLAQLLHCFDLELPDGISPKDVDMEEKFGLTTPRANPLLVVPTYRLLLSTT